MVDGTSRITVVAHLILGVTWTALAVWFHGTVPTVTVVVPGALILVLGWRLDETNLIRLLVAAAAVWLAAAWFTVGNSAVVGVGSVLLAGVVAYPLREVALGPRRTGTAAGALPRLLAGPNSLVLWLILVVLVAYGFQTGEGAYSFDLTHPLYELSIGNSYSRSILETPDLSLDGKDLRFHFLSTQMVRLIRAVGIPPISATYFVGPSLLALLVFFTFGAFFSREGVGRYTAVLLFLPVLVLMESTFYPETTFRRFFAVTPSFSLGIIFFIAFWTEVVRHRRYTAGWLISLALLLTKATFFPVVAGGLVLRWFFVERPQRDHRILPLLGAMAVTFFAGYALFFSGAHSHNHWVLGPNFLYRIVIEGDVIHAIYFLALLALVGYRIKTRRLEDIDWFVISGLLGTLLIAEITEYGNYQFLGAASPFLLVIVARTLAPRLPRWVAFTAVLAVLASSVYILSGFAVTAVEKVADDTSWGRRILTMDKPPLVSNEVIAAYDALSRINGGGTRDGAALVYFPPTYELESSYEGTRFSPDTGFLRSALADRPFYRENFKYKGLAMEPAFISRFGDSLFWYDVLFEKTPETQELFDLLVESTGSYERGEPFGPDAPLNRRLIYYAGLGTEWSWFNWRYVVLHDAYRHYLELKDTVASASGAPARAQVTIDPQVGFVVSERGDIFHPPEDASGRPAWEQIWSAGDTAIWVRRETQAGDAMVTRRR